MKKKMITVFLALVAVGCTVSFAGTRIPEVPMAVIKSGSVFKVIYKSHTVSTVTVSIYDQDGTVVFREDVSSVEGFIKPYNLSQMPEGNYKITVADKAYVFTESITTASSEPPLVAQVIKLDEPGEKYLVSVPHQGDAQIDILIYDDLNRLLYNETAPANIDFAKVFDLKNVDSGSTVHVVNQTSGEAKVTEVR